MSALEKYYVEDVAMKGANKSRTSGNNENADSTLAEENQLLRNKLQEVITQARQNQDKLKRFQSVELKLISCTSFTALMKTLLNDYRMVSQLDFVSLTLHDPEYEYQRILEEEGLDLRSFKDLSFTDSVRDIEAYLGARPAPYLGPYINGIHNFLFQDCKRSPVSIALLPIINEGAIVGTLNLGSFKSERFVSGIASDFLQRLSTITGICLNNTLNNERMKRVGLTDVLTGVNNRRFFDQRLKEEVSSAQRHVSSLSCLFFDVDHFKQVNDTYGHHAGDIVLKEVAELIRSSLRTGDVLARYGGEEFSALLSKTSTNKAYEIAERIRSNIEQKKFKIDKGRTIKITISIGMSTYIPDMNNNTTPDIGQKLVGEADANLYQAKRSGRNKVVTPQMDFDFA